jgi:hypothetical protein
MRRVSLWNVFFGLTVALGVPLLLAIAWFSWRAWIRAAPRRRIVKAIGVRASSPARSWSVYSLSKKDGAAAWPLTPAQAVEAQAGLRTAFSYGDAYMFRPRGIVPCYEQFDSGLKIDSPEGEVRIDLDFHCDNFTAVLGDDSERGMMGAARRGLEKVVYEASGGKLP